ncbi:SH3 domain-containing protein [Paraliomyxa miuraensis]|uniref:SH3 domain-containing protein n=1 Tax=Paraliomyxa miuraensis TaxID=376150 RepID=UPI0022566381|nr:SH3 domain-containing protein [Paraliomyxa miuraensis]MCX4246047.1 SH3 domain-containing protein [Paraliomyxa miuraensis]
MIRARRWARAWARKAAGLALGGVLLLAPDRARADAVDEAFARGSQAAQDGDWEQAIAAYEQAAALLPERSAVLSYDLGTAYLHHGDVGRATFHLRRALDWRGGPTAELAESARFNLGVARRRAEMQAAGSGAKIDRPETWWDLVVEALRAPGVGWSALVAGWLVLGLGWLRGRRRRRGQSGSTAIGAVLLVLASIYLGLGVLHGLALRADRTAPEAIVLEDLVDARDGAGNHRRVAFRLQGGARVRVVGRSPGWRQVRLPGGLEGWVHEGAIGELGDRGTGRAGPPRPRIDASEDADGDG